MTSSGPVGSRRGRSPATAHHSTSPRRPRSQASGPGVLGDLVHRYGWRIYALPALALVTIAALFQPGHAHTSAQAAPPASAAGLRRTIASTTASTPASTPATTPPTTTPPTTTPPTTTPPSTRIRSENESTACAHNSKPTYVLVDISAQHAWMCDGARQVNASAVTTGATALGDATPTGSWIVAAKQPNRWLTGKDYDRFVHYWVPFDGNIGFHDAGWQTMPFGAAGYATLGSHGCVHLPTPMMGWLYHWIQPGRTTVTVIA